MSQSTITDISRRSPLLLDPGPYGGRYGLDAFLLADFASNDWDPEHSHHTAEIGRPKLADLCTGTGVVALLLAYRCPTLRLFGIDLQEHTLRIAMANARGSCLRERIDFILADLRQADHWFGGGEIDGAVINPPYRSMGSGRMSPNPARAMSRYELTLPLESWLGAAAHMIRLGGSLIFCHMAERELEVIQAAQSLGFQLVRLRRVHPMKHRPPMIILAKAVLKKSVLENNLEILSPLIVYKKPGMYTGDVRNIYERFGINL